MSVFKLFLFFVWVEKKKLCKLDICVLIRIWECIYRFNLDVFFFISIIYSCEVLMEGYLCLVVIVIVFKNSGKELKDIKKMFFCIENLVK